MSNILDGLNPAQTAAVTNYQSPSLIIAGAGSGKTRVLTARIAYMIEQGVAPQSIMALTFTNKAAAQMKERLQQMVNPSLTRHITMGTFHSIFSRIIRENAEALGFPTTYTIYQPSDAKSLIKTIVKELNLSEERYKPNSILSRISFAKNSLITPAAYQGNTNLAVEDREMRIPQFGEIYRLYCARCKASGALDFDDLLLQTNILFRDFPEILARYQERYQYLLVDEYQDTNYAQYIIIRRLAQYHGRVCVVGDDAQSIYSFRGAKIENILNFKKHFPAAMTFKLEQNYRSTQTIVDAANSLIAHNKTKLDKRCFSASDQGEKILIMRAMTDREEAQLVVEQILQREMSGAAYRDMAILYRTNSQSQAMEQRLRQNGVPYKIHRGSSFYEHKEIKDMMAYVRLVINPRDDEAFKRIINYPVRGIGGVTVERIATLAEERKVSMWEAIDTLVQQQPADATERTIIRKVGEFVELIRTLSIERSQLSLYDFGMRVATATGILPQLRLQKTPEATSAVDNIEELLNTMQIFTEQFEEDQKSGERDESEVVTVEEWLQSVLLLTNDEGEGEDEDNRVTLMTVHSSKGLEYDYVYIVGVEHNLFPSQRAMESGEIEEERRLFYVALTRAKLAVALSYCDQRMKWGNMEMVRPSSFLGEIDPCYVELGHNVQLRRGAGERPTPRATTNPTMNRQGASRPPRELTNAKFIAPTVPSKPRIPEPQRDVRGMRSMGVRRAESEETTTQPSGSMGGYSVGDRVRHRNFGVGRVVEIGAWASGALLTIDFESIGIKKIVSNVPSLSKM